jgi:hypothetical protein
MDFEKPPNVTIYGYITYLKYKLSMTTEIELQEELHREIKKLEEQLHSHKDLPTLDQVYDEPYSDDSY